MTSQNQTYYQILGVSQDASAEEIRAAYWEAQARWHLQFECMTNPHSQISPLHHD